MGKLRDLVSFITAPWRADSGDGSRGDRWYVIGGQGAGQRINEKSALAISTYYACIRNIAEDTAKLPFKLLESDGDRRKPVADILKTLFTTQPNPRMTAFTFRSTMMQWAAGWGNAYAEIRRRPDGRVGELNPIHPSRVMPFLNADGSYRYEVYNDDGSKTPIPTERMFHLYGMSGDGRMGYSVVKLMTNTLGAAGAVQRLTKKYYENGAIVGGMLETDMQLKPEIKAALAASWAKMYSGPDNAGKTPILDYGIHYKTITLPLKDMEFMELRKFQKEQIAEWFRMPLYKLQYVGTAQGWSTLDAQETDYVNSCLMPWLLRFEQEVRRQLMDPNVYPENVDPHLEVKGLLRGDMKARSEFCNGMQDRGGMTPNERRMYEDMEPIDDPAADRLYINSTMIPLDKAGTQQAPTQPTKAA